MYFQPKSIAIFLIFIFLDKNVVFINTHAVYVCINPCPAEPGYALS